MELKPITRQEKIIAGENLTPITRMEKFLKNFGGGGGGDILDTNGKLLNSVLPEGYPYKEHEVLFDIVDGIFEYDDEDSLWAHHAANTNNIEIVLGNTYTVIWDGIVYDNLVAFADEEFATLGAVYGETSDAMPFCIYNSAEKIYIITHSDATMHSVKVESITSHSIDHKFLPDPDMIIEWDNGDEYSANFPEDKSKLTITHGNYDSLIAKMQSGQEPHILLHCTYNNGAYHAYPKVLSVETEDLDRGYDVIMVYAVNNNSMSMNWKVARIDICNDGGIGWTNYT